MNNRMPKILTSPTKNAREVVNPQNKVAGGKPRNARRSSAGRGKETLLATTSMWSIGLSLLLILVWCILMTG